MKLENHPRILAALVFVAAGAALVAACGSDDGGGGGSGGNAATDGGGAGGTSGSSGSSGAGAGGTSGAGGSGGAKPCGALTNCGNGICADTNNDAKNCGSCGYACPAGQVCVDGVCGTVCGSGTTKCGQKCVDTNNDPSHCGGCDLPCTGGQVCSLGQCGGTCGGGLQMCGSKCADTQNDPANCGTCGTACPSGQLCAAGVCASICPTGSTPCGSQCVNTQTSSAHCGACGSACPSGQQCVGGVCSFCDATTTDCDGDGWLVADGDCCDKPGLCGADPSLVNPGAFEVVGNGLDDNCNAKIDLFDKEDTLSCDLGLASSSTASIDYAKALGICRSTTEAPALKKDKTWGLLSTEFMRADGTPLQDFSARSIRTHVGSSIVPTEGDSVVLLAGGIASDATQTDPGPNKGAPTGTNISNVHSPSSVVSLATGGTADSIGDWFKTANPPLKQANQFPAAPGCGGAGVGQTLARDSVCMKLKVRAPTNARAFSFNSYFLSAEFPEWVCTNYNDQYVVLVDTPAPTAPIPNPIDKNLMLFTDLSTNTQWPIGINVAFGTNLFAVCDPTVSLSGNPCYDPQVNAKSCSLGAGDLLGTGFEKSATGSCPIGGGTFWLTTSGNVIPGDVLTLRICIFDVYDHYYDSMTVIDGFEWLTTATLPGTG